MSKVLILGLLCAWLTANVAVPLSAQDPPKPTASKPGESEKSAATGVPARPEFLFHVVDSQGRPVVGATVTARSYTYRNVGNFSAALSADDVAPAVTDSNGLASLVFETDANHASRTAVKRLLDYGFYRLSVMVEHPDHPICWVATIDPLNAAVITLADSNQVDIRAHRTNETVAAHHLYPVLSPPTADWAEATDGKVTIRRVDLSSDRATRWLRVVQVTDEGPAWFSEGIDLLQQNRGLISIDTELKRGVRVEGLLDPQVPRPVQNGHALAEIANGDGGPPNNSYWVAVADIAPDGSFTLPSLPPNEYLQMTAICDGWVSTNPTDEELGNYSKLLDARGADPRPFQELRVCAQVFHLASQKITPTIAMQRTATCEVTVLDENDRPLRGAQVHFGPPVGWYYGIQANGVGFGVDELSTIRNTLIAGDRKEGKSRQNELQRATTARYEAITDARGVVVVPNLPAGTEKDKAPGIDKTFFVVCKGYFVTQIPSVPNFPDDSQPSTVNLKPGESSRVTVHMQKAPE